MSPRSKNHDRQGNLRESIKETAWNQIEESGAAALSLRSIAQVLGITAPAIYNYYPNRDALVTALIRDAFQSFGDSQLAARDAVPEADLRGRMTALGLAYRSWAHEFPERYGLMFGTPFPGFVLEPEQILPVGARALGVLAGVVEAMRKTGLLKATGIPSIMSTCADSFDAWKRYGGDIVEESFALAVLIWAAVHGLVSLELSRNIPPFGPRGDALYRYQLEALKRQFVKD